MNTRITPTQTIYVVAKPTSLSVLEDICFETNLAGLELQFKGGLTANEIHGIYTDRHAAVTAAEVLLHKRSQS